MNEQVAPLPMFPLGTVLFPHAPLPLHIFEPRYQKMIQDCLQGDKLFGVCLIRSGQEVGGPAARGVAGRRRSPQRTRNASVRVAEEAPAAPATTRSR